MLTPFHRLDALLPLQQTLWGVPLCLTLHNAEEALGVSALVVQLRRLFPWFMWSARRFLGALALVTVLVWGLALLLDAADRVVFLLSVQAILCVNVFIPHLLLTFRLRRYTPGVATAVLLILPYSLYLVWQLAH